MNSVRTLNLPSRHRPTYDWWLATTHHTAHRGQRMEFDRHSYQVAILKDKAGEIVIRKSTQCGVSECEIIHALALVDNARNVFWVFPDQNLRNAFAKDRIDLTLAVTPYYRRLVYQARARVRTGRQVSDEVALKQIGRGTIALVGSNTRAGFRSFSADDAIIDEVDECDQSNLPLIDGRLAHSEYRTRWWVGNPSMPGYGIDKRYGESDRRQWFVTCDHCGDRQPLDWFVNVVREIDDGRYELRGSGNGNGVRSDFSTAYSSRVSSSTPNPVAAPEPRDDPAICVCRKCEQPIDRLAHGEWVAEYPERQTSGYHISQLFSGSVPLSEMCGTFFEALSDESRLQAFYNDCLGIPHTAVGSRLTEGLIARCVGEHGEAARADAAVMGVDVGKQLHFEIRDTANRVIRLGTTIHFEDLDALMLAYRIECAVIDALPETRKAMEFADRFSGRVYLCYYHDDAKKEDITPDPDNHRVLAHRTQSMDASHAAMLREEVLFPRDAASVEDWTAQMTAPARLIEEKTVNGVLQRRYVWSEGGKADHYRHAHNYAHIAQRLRTEVGRAVLVFT